MQTRLLDLYNRELAYLHEMGREFAAAHPKVAGRLGMNGIEVADPYVERLLEGFAFLTARVQLKMDAEFPRFTQQLLEAVYPGFLSPLPSMCLARFEPAVTEGSLASGFTLPAGTPLHAGLTPGQMTACEFRTAHAVTLWPLTLARVDMGPVPASAPAQPGRTARSALRLSLQVQGGMDLSTLPLDRLDLCITAPERSALRLLELLMAHAVGVYCEGFDDAAPRAGAEPATAPRWQGRLAPEALRHEGFGADQALLPADPRVFQGYRILQEYFAFPARAMFVSVNGLKQAIAGRKARRLDVVVLLDEADAVMERAVDASWLSLYCTPAINLATRRTDRILVSPRHHEYHLVVDRTRPLDHEVHSVLGVTGHFNGQTQPQPFRPFFASFAHDGQGEPAYFSVRREPRLVSEQARRQGPRSAYLGSEVFLSLVDTAQAPFADDLRHLGAEVLCTHRDLPLLMPLGGQTDFSLAVSAPVRSVRVLRGPTRPGEPVADDAVCWRLVSHLGLQYHALTEAGEERGAQVLREMLSLYTSAADASLQRQVQGVQRAGFTPVFQRLPHAGPIAHGRGVRIDLRLDDQAFSGDSPWLFGAVLEQFFARHVSVNLFTELHLHSLQRGPLASWPARMGRRPSV